jgi:hypothetical protein
MSAYSNQEKPMLDITYLAQEAINALTPVLTLAAAKAGEGFLSEPGAKLYNWLTEKVKGTPSAEPLNRAVAEPQNPRRLQALQLEIEDLADKDQHFRQQLEEILKSIPPTKSTSQTAAINGDNNNIAQVSGKNNTTQSN